MGPRLCSAVMPRNDDTFRVTGSNPRQGFLALLQLAVLVSLATLLTLPGCGESGEPGPSAGRPHGIVLIVLDTLRADALSAYGNPRDTTPAIDGLAKRGVLFEQAVSHSSWTLPGFVGLLSGSYPSTQTFSDGLLRESMVEGIRAAGFATAAFTESGYVSRHFGMDRGFDHFEERLAKIRVPGTEDAKLRGGIKHTVGSAITWLRDNSERPFFLLVHSYEPHIPYKRTHYAKGLPSGTLDETYGVPSARAVRAGETVVGDTERAYVRALYDGGARFADRQVARLLEVLDELALTDRTVVVVTSDHGEDLGDRDPRDLGRHQHHLYDELLLVPLIVVAPQRIWPTDRVKPQVRLVDVMPTVLALAGLPEPEGTDGRSLLPLMQGAGEAPRRAYATLREGSSQLVALRVNGRKLISKRPLEPEGRVHDELYDLRLDPLERTDLAGESRDTEVRMRALIDRHIGERELAEPDAAAPCEADPALCAQLEALGYVDP
jgi:arylsulfatase A-like enzyme